MNLLDIAIAKKMSGGGGSEPTIEALSVTENGTYTAPSGVDGYNPITVNVSGGGGGSANIGTATTTTATEVTSTISTVTFEGIQGEPKCFFLRCTNEFFRSTSDSSYYILAMSYDGTGYQSATYYRAGGQTYNNDSSTKYSFTYSDGTLVIQSKAGKAYKNGGFYPSVGYSLVYVY